MAAGRSCANIRSVDDFDHYYRAAPDVFGAEPERTLVEFADLLDSAHPVLDVGCGQGRNSLFLGRRGFNVDALDPSQVAVEQVARAATSEALPVRAIQASFQDVANDRRAYGGLLVFGLITVLTRPQVGELVRAVDRLLRPGGIVFLTAFGTWDPDFSVRAAQWTEEDRNSFRALDGRLRTYLEPGELEALFPGLATVHSWEGLGPEHRHGDGPPERHGVAEAVMQRQPS